ncbi:hypothetical protein NC652_018578 [Populus alba x Populus x berolinensis]|nr:hypothetical protein NC652_018578 [Populus alba x Populus x berolinensis]
MGRVPEYQTCAHKDSSQGREFKFQIFILSFISHL